MQLTTPKKTESKVIVVPAPERRMKSILQRSSTFRSGKAYRRKEGKKVEG